MWKYTNPSFYDVKWKCLYLGFHSRLNWRIERAHGNIWSFIRCIVSEESRFQHLHAQMNAGAKRRPLPRSTNDIQNRINILTERYNNNINVEQLLDSLLSLLVARKAYIYINQMHLNLLNDSFLNKQLSSLAHVFFFLNEIK